VRNFTSRGNHEIEKRRLATWHRCHDIDRAADHPILFPTDCPARRSGRRRRCHVRRHGRKQPKVTADRHENQQPGKPAPDAGRRRFQRTGGAGGLQHEIALGYGRTAAQSTNHDYALAGLWIQVLAYADSRQEAKARAVFPELVAKDDKLTSEIQAETEMRETLKKLMDIRQENGRPAFCG
jgi:hypothetical protein